MAEGSAIIGSRVGFVLGLGREELRAEIFRLDAAISSYNEKIQHLSDENSKLTDRLMVIMDRDSDRYDVLLAKQEQILDARLGLGVPLVAKTMEVKPLGHNRNWKADFEKKQRDAHWTKVIEQQEAKDLAAKVDSK